MVLSYDPNMFAVVCVRMCVYFNDCVELMVFLP